MVSMKIEPLNRFRLGASARAAIRQGGGAALNPRPSASRRYTPPPLPSKVDKCENGNLTMLKGWGTLNRIRASTCDKHSGSMKITTHLDPPRREPSGVDVVDHPLKKFTTPHRSLPHTPTKFTTPQRILLHSYEVCYTPKEGS